MEFSPVLPIIGQNLLPYFDGYLEFLALLENFVFIPRFFAGILMIFFEIPVGKQ